MACFIKPANLHSPGQVQSPVLFCSELWSQHISTTELSCRMSKVREISDLHLPSEIPLGTGVLGLPQLLGDFPHKYINFVFPTRSCTVTCESTAKPRFRIKSKLMPLARKARHLRHFFSSLTYATTPNTPETLNILEFQSTAPSLLQGFSHLLAETSSLSKITGYGWHSFPHFQKAFWDNLFVVVQLLSCVWLLASPWTAACQAPLSSTISWSLLKFLYIEWCYLSISSSAASFSFLPSIFPSIRVFSNEHSYKAASISHSLHTYPHHFIVTPNFVKCFLRAGRFSNFLVLFFYV